MAKYLVGVTLKNKLNAYSQPNTAIKYNRSYCQDWARCCDNKGYGLVSFKGLQMRAHRASWIAHYGPIPKNKHILHGCDNPRCINPRHLYLGDHALNMADMAARGRATGKGQPGELCHSAKLTVAIVRTIRTSTEKQKDLATKFGVSQAAISQIQLLKTWKHV